MWQTLGEENGVKMDTSGFSVDQIIARLKIM